MFPTSIPSYAGFTASHTLAADSHASQHNQEQADITAIAQKIGTGSSTPTSATLLRGTGSGTSSWGQAVLSTDVTGVLPVANGGTGGSTSTDARTNLSVYSQAQVDAAILAAKQALYPVGCVYTETTGANPAVTFGFGTWTAFGAGRVLMGNGTSDATYNAGSTGGASTVDSSHTHTLSDNGQADVVMSGANVTERRVSSASWTASHQFTATGAGTTNTSGAQTVGAGLTGNTDTGGSSTLSTLQPYLVVYFWQRTA